MRVAVCMLVLVLQSRGLAKSSKSYACKRIHSTSRVPWRCASLRGLCACAGRACSCVCAWLGVAFQQQQHSLSFAMHVCNHVCQTYRE